MNINEEWLDKYQKNLKELKRFINNKDKVEILKVSFENAFK